MVERYTTGGVIDCRRFVLSKDFVSAGQRRGRLVVEHPVGHVERGRVVLSFGLAVELAGARAVEVNRW